MAVRTPSPNSKKNVQLPSKTGHDDHMSISHHDSDDTTTLCTLDQDNFLSVLKGSQNKPFEGNCNEPEQHEIFGTALGTILNEYPCYNAIHNGMLYTGTNAIGFFSNKVFGFERRIEIPLENITDLIRLERNQDICIKTNSINHTFKDFRNRDVVLTEIYDLAKSNGRGGYATAQRNLKLISNMAELHSNRTSFNVEKNIIHEDDSVKETQSHKSKAALSLIASIASLDPDKVIPIHPARVKKYRIVDHTSQEPTKKGLGTKEESVEQQWLQVKALHFNSLKETAIKNIKLSCSIDEFFSKFFANDAMNSIEKFQSEKIGDFDLETTPWIFAPGNQSQTRIIRYKHPMNIPMAPPSARATKEQTLHHKSSYGICISTCTTSYDAPTTDCFTVQDAFLVEPSGEGVSVTIKFEVRFVKHTLFRTFVELTTRKEFKKWFKGFTHMMVNVMNEDNLLADDGSGGDSTAMGDTDDDDNKSNLSVENLNDPKSVLFASSFASIFPLSRMLTAIILLLLLFGQAAMMYQLSSYNRSLQYSEIAMADMIITHQSQLSEFSSLIHQLQDQMKESSSQICDKAYI